MVAMIVALSIDYNTIGRYWKLIYFLNILLLIFVKFFGATRKGAQSWIDLGFFDLQPSEFAKIAVIITLAKVIDANKNEISTFKGILKVGIHVGLPTLLIFLQPDLGTALVFVVITALMLFVAGLDWKIIGLSIGGFIAALPVMWMVMAPYQRERILVFLNPERDPLGRGYNVIQSKIAIGSGQLLGRGLGESRFNQLKFLPERHTDFVFSVIGEVFGLVGALVVISLLLIVLLRCIRAAVKAKDLYGSLIVIGVVGILTFQTYENIGMTMGIMPVTGIPLPFLTYGGSSLMSMMLAIGLVLNVGMRNQKIKF